MLFFNDFVLPAASIFVLLLQIRRVQTEYDYIWYWSTGWKNSCCHRNSSAHETILVSLLDTYQRGTLLHILRVLACFPTQSISVAAKVPPKWPKLLQHIRRLFSSTDSKAPLVMETNVFNCRRWCMRYSASPFEAYAALTLSYTPLLPFRQDHPVWRNPLGTRLGTVASTDSHCCYKNVLIWSQ